MSLRLAEARFTPAAGGRRRVALSAVLLGCVLAAGCANSGPGSAPITTRAPALPALPSQIPLPPPPSPAADATAAAVTAYRGYWDDAVYANAQSGYWNAATRASLGAGGTLFDMFSRHATGTAFEQQILSVYRADRSGEFTEGELVPHPVVQSALPPTIPFEVRIADCLDARNWLVRRRPAGELKNGRPGRKHSFLATVVREGGGWRVRDLTSPSGTTTC